MTKPTMELAEFISGLTFDQISGKALARIKECIVDCIGCACYGSSSEWGLIVNEYVKSQKGIQEATLWTTDFIGPAATVVLGNGTMIHSFDFDDFHKMKVHPGAVVVPAALAIGENERIDGKSLMTAIVAGYETMIHVSRGLNPGASRLKGWHLTGTCGTLGAAAAVAHIWKFDSKNTASALGMAGTQSSGLWAFTADGSYSKRFHPGRAAQSGIMAASLARLGYQGPKEILEAEDGGLFNATSNDFDFSMVTAGLGEKFDSEDVVIKPYPACGSLHSSIDAVFIIGKENTIVADEIERINVYNSELVNVQCGFDYKPMGVLQAQMSMKYCVARAVMDGKLSVAQFSEDKLSDPAVVNLARRVHFVLDREINNIYPKEFPSIVEIALKDGRKYKVRVDVSKGSEKNPVSRNEVQDKFRSLAIPVLGKEKASEIAAQIENLDELEDVSKVVARLRG